MARINRTNHIDVWYFHDGEWRLVGSIAGLPPGFKPRIEEGPSTRITQPHDHACGNYMPRRRGGR